MDANYDYKYTDREYEVLMLKKELKEKKPKGSAPVNLDDSHQEMNELLSSDEEVNAADVDENFNQLNGYRSIDDDDDFDADCASLMDSDEERAAVRKRKEREGKINNSFTGPYPLDPTDFNHTDKGPNYQFGH
jgi:hypothetical protein